MELTLENIIKIILGVLVFAVVIYGVYYFFKNYFIEFFKGGTAGAVLGIAKKGKFFFKKGDGYINLCANGKKRG